MNKHEAEQEVLKALGLDHLAVEKLKVSLCYGQDPRVEVVFLVPPERLGDLGTRLKTFKLVPVEGDHGQ